MPGNVKPPAYEGEYPFAERRLFERCSPLQRFKALLLSGDRRTSPGRRKDDRQALYAAGLSFDTQ